MSSGQWIKPSELPENFFGECWVCWKSWTGIIHEPRQFTVQNVYRGGIPEFFDGDFYRFISDDEYRVMMVNKPSKPTEQEWES